MRFMGRLFSGFVSFIRFFPSFMGSMGFLSDLYYLWDWLKLHEIYKIYGIYGSFCEIYYLWDRFKLHQIYNIYETFSRFMSFIRFFPVFRDLWDFFQDLRALRFSSSFIGFMRLMGFILWFFVIYYVHIFQWTISSVSVFQIDNCHFWIQFGVRYHYIYAN